jgi:hypothetical protein
MKRNIWKNKMGGVVRAWRVWAERSVGRCRLPVSKPVLKAPVVSALEAILW